MKISIIIPYKDAAKYIDRCSDSLREQNGDFEFIFVDDYSTDGAIPKGDGFIVLENEFHPGVSGARNTGIKYAGGEWITFLDVDDVLLKDAYKKFCSVIESDPDADVHQLNHIRRYVSKNTTGIKFANNEGKYQLPLLPDAWWAVWNKLFRSSLIKNVRFDEDLQYGEDGLFVLECMAITKYIHCGKRQMMGVEHILENKQSLSHLKKGEDILKQIRTYLDFLERQNDPDLRLLVMREVAKLCSEKRLQKIVCNG